MKNINWNEWKCRASLLPSIMSEGREVKITEKQLATIAEFQNKEKLTAKQQEELERLITKRDAPPALSATAKSALVDVWIEEVTGRKKLTDSKYTIKGIIGENDSIDLYNSVTLSQYEKSEDFRENDYINGHPDIVDIENKKIIDIKTAFDIWTFFGDKEKELMSNYYWQIVGYCWLYGYSKGSIVYTLIDTPDEIISAEQYSASFKFGDTEAIQNQILHNMTYSDISAEMRVKEYNINLDGENIFIKIKQKVNLAREFLNTLKL